MPASSNVHRRVVRKRFLQAVAAWLPPALLVRTVLPNSRLLPAREPRAMAAGTRSQRTDKDNCFSISDRRGWKRRISKEHSPSLSQTRNERRISRRSRKGASRGLGHARKTPHGG